MNSFFLGFEKRAEEKPTLRDTLTAGYAAPLLAGAAAEIPVSILDRLESSIPFSEAKKFVKKINKSKGLNTKLIEIPESKKSWFERFPGEYYPSADTVGLTKKTSLSTVAHEMGHSSMMPLLRKDVGLNKLVNMSRSGSFVAGLLATPLALSGEGFVQEAAPYIAPLAATPLVMEEAIASIRGIKDIAKHYGARKAIRSVPPLLGALGTYAAAPAASYYYSKKYLDKKRKK